ncbi:hypothetical protein IEQ34_012348 [Dendrobium chrysotoxum]|uniref:Uncharacterized protein n=1 Tax=Dendrobium chrysotoxum TaxID=161865 RepID=A0AAV7GUV0_DENCH|nr:hypothetical protein IEQ34_012348 [Dendrobium chrysotoxum]
MGRAPCCDKANVKKGPWSPEEDAKLKSYIEEHGTGNNWIALPQKIGLKRCGKSCRLRWLNYLRPNIKHGGFSEEEDRIICNLYISIGSRWSIIAAQLPGRTDNDIKNYWNTRLKKKLLGRRRDLPPSQFRQLAAANHKLKDEGVNSNPNHNPNECPQTLTSSALERLQLHFQLQSLHSPFSFYNNTSLWPNNKLLQTINSTDSIATAASPLKNFQQNDISNSTIANMQEHIGIPSSYSNNLDADIQNLLYGYKENYQLTQVDCLKGIMNDDQKGIDWWESNEFEEKFPSSSWDSASVLQPDTVVIQDYELGYDQ